MSKSVIVVGAGIIGSAFAMELAEAGANVTLVDRSGPASGATSKSFAWINAHETANADYAALRQASIARYRAFDPRLQDAMGMVWRGTLNCHGDAAALETEAAALTSMGHAARIIGANAIADLEPALTARPDAGLYCENEGAVDPAAATRAFARCAAEAGARIIYGCDVTALTMVSDRVTGIATTFGQLTADTVVLAGGAGTRALAQTVGVDIPMSNRFGVLLRTLPLQRFIERVVLLDGLDVRQERDGTVIAAPDFSGAPVAGGGETAAAIDPSAIATELRARLREWFSCPATPHVDVTTFGERPVPADGLPAIGRVPDREGLFVAVMHSGITLAPIVGLLGAREVLDDVDSDRLAPYRLDRFIQTVSS
ncbi:MAG: FAD-binding oxidoreductase [Pseudomonadota bacterium]